MPNNKDEDKARLEKLEIKKQERRDATRKFKSEPLKITSLMDALTIILIFLLKSYGSDPMEVQQKKGELMLPKSSSVSNMAECIDIQITNSGKVVVKGETLLKEDGNDKLNIKEYSEMLIPALKDRLDELRKQAALQKKETEGSKDIDVNKYEGEAFIAAHRDIPLKVIKQIIYTAGRAKYTRFTFAVIKTRGG